MKDMILKAVEAKASSITYCDKQGSRDRKAIIGVFCSDGSFRCRVGRTSTDELTKMGFSVLKSRFEKAGKWSGTDWQLVPPAGCRVITTQQEWDYNEVLGQTLPALAEQCHTIEEFTAMASATTSLIQSRAKALAAKEQNCRWDDWNKCYKRLVPSPVVKGHFILSDEIVDIVAEDRHIEMIINRLSGHFNPKE